MVEIADYPFNSVRLGNRLFIYAYARIIADTLGLYLPKTNLTLFKGNDADKINMDEVFGKKYELPIFNIDDNIAFSHSNISNVIELIKKYHLMSKIVVNGYLPNYRYFQGYEDKIKNIYSSFIEPLSYNKKEVAIHLRKSHEDKRFYLPPTYYINILNKIKPEMVYIFADDINRHSWVIQKLTYPHKVMNLSPIQSIKEMSKFSTLILSQGTFSFFAGYLSNATEIYLPITTTGPNSREEPLMDLIVENTKYIHIPVDNKVFV